MILDKYAGVEKPQEKQNIPLGTNYLEVVTNAFTVWSHLLLKTAAPYPGAGIMQRDFLLEEAVRFLPVRLPPVVSEKSYFQPIETLPFSHRPFAGLFYTAMLEKGVEKLIVPGDAKDIALWGYKMKTGTVDVLADSRSIGVRSTGGICINRGCVANFAAEAEGGIHVNYGVVHYYGSQAKNIIFINHGHASVTPHIVGGIYFNYAMLCGHRENFIYNATSRILFYDKAITPHLRKILRDVCAATQNKIDSSYITSLVQKIKEDITQSTQHL